MKRYDLDNHGKCDPYCSAHMVEDPGGDYIRHDDPALRELIEAARYFVGRYPNNIGALAIRVALAAFNDVEGA